MFQDLRFETNGTPYGAARPLFVFVYTGTQIQKEESGLAVSDYLYKAACQCVLHFKRSY